jgi:hypothetical protein
MLCSVNQANANVYPVVTGKFCNNGPSIPTNNYISFMKPNVVSKSLAHVAIAHPNSHTLLYGHSQFLI